METFESIRKAIINDPENQAFRKLGYEPIYLAHPQARILIIGQAPGIKTQLKNEVFRDQSGDTLRQWLGVDTKTFYQSGLISVLPLDFYYPGKAKTGDLPPRKGFADKWHPRLIALMPNIELTILIGVYAQKATLKERVKKNLTETVFAYKEYLPTYFPIVHPSPLNFRWHRKHPTFKELIVPELQALCRHILHKQND